MGRWSRTFYTLPFSYIFVLFSLCNDFYYGSKIIPSYKFLGMNVNTPPNLSCNDQWMYSMQSSLVSPAHSQPAFREVIVHYPPLPLSDEITESIAMVSWTRNELAGS